MARRIRDGMDPIEARRVTLAETSGRELTDADGESGVPVALVNQQFAKMHWPGENPLGRRLRLFAGQTPQEWLTVVGVASNIEQDGRTPHVSRLDGTNAGLLVATILPVPLLVLVIACVNAANLLLVRASRRGREMALRLALGASRLRLVRQLVIESLVLAMGAALLALPLAWWGMQLVAASMVFPMPLDGTVVAGALVTTFLTALGFGLVPALQSTRQEPSAALGTSPAGAEARVRSPAAAGPWSLFKSRCRWACWPAGSS